MKELIEKLGVVVLVGVVTIMILQGITALGRMLFG